MDVEDRPRGILSDADREYLLATVEEREDNYTRQARSNRRKAIRERIRASVRDLELLHTHLDDEELERAVNDDGFDMSELIDTLRAGTAFLFQFGQASTEPLDTEAVIRDGIQEGRSGRIQALLQQYERDPKSLTLGELEELRGAGAIQREEYRDHRGGSTLSQEDSDSRTVADAAGGFGIPDALVPDGNVTRAETVLRSHENVEAVRVIPNGVEHTSADADEGVMVTDIQVVLTEIEDPDAVLEDLSKRLREEVPQLDDFMLREVDDLPGDD